MENPTISSYLSNNVSVATQYVTDQAGEVFTQPNIADAGGWYAGRMITTYGPDLAIYGLTQVGIAALGGGAVLTGTGLGLAFAPFFVPIVVPIAAKVATESTRYVFNKAIDLTRVAMGYELEESLPTPVPADQEAPVAEEKTEKPKEKKEEKSFAYKCGEAAGQTFGPGVLNRVAEVATIAVFGPTAGRVLAVLVTAPLLTPMVTPGLSQLTGAGIEHGVAALASKKSK